MTQAPTRANQTLDQLLKKLSQNRQQTSIEPKPQRNTNKSEKQISDKSYESICLIRDQTDAFSSFTGIYGYYYFVTAPNCIHNIDYNSKFNKETARTRNLNYYEFESAINSLPCVPKKKLKIACDICVDKKWLELNSRKISNLILIAFRDKTNFTDPITGQVNLRPAGLFEVFEDCVVIDSSHSKFVEKKRNLQRLVDEILSITKSFNFERITFDVESEQVAKQLANEFGLDQAYYVHPALESDVEITPINLSDDELEYFIPEKETVVEESEPEQPIIVPRSYEEVPISEVIGKRNRRERTSAYLIIGGKLSVLQRQFIPQLSTEISDTTLYRLVQNAQKYWVQVLIASKPGTTFSITSDPTVVNTLKCDTIIDLITKDHYSIHEIISPYIVIALIEASNTYNGVISVSQNDQNIEFEYYPSIDCLDEC